MIEKEKPLPLIDAVPNVGVANVGGVAGAGVEKVTPVEDGPKPSEFTALK